MLDGRLTPERREGIGKKGEERGERREGRGDGWGVGWAEIGGGDG